MRANAESATREMGLEQAKASGAIGLFGEKYADDVRVVSTTRSVPVQRDPGTGA